MHRPQDAAGLVAYVPYGEAHDDGQGRTEDMTVADSMSACPGATRTRLVSTHCPASKHLSAQTVAPETDIIVNHIIIRACQNSDRRPCEELIRGAFWDVYRPGCVEHLLAHQAWDSPDLAFALIAEDDDIAGCLIGTLAQVAGPSGRTRQVLYLGPLAVSPARQHEGIGTQLMQHGLTEGARLGLAKAFLYGDPGYYARFGFRNAASLGVSTAKGANFDAFMGIELAPARKPGEDGRLHEASVFDFSPDRLAEFDAQFPIRVKHVRPGQFAQ